MKSPIIKWSVVLNGHKTSVSLEEPFWLELKSIAAERKVALGDLISKIDAERQHSNLSSALRLFVLARYGPEPHYRPECEVKAGQSERQDRWAVMTQQAINRSPWSSWWTTTSMSARA